MLAIDNKFCILMLLSATFLLVVPFQLFAQNEIQFSFGGPHEDFGRMAIETDDKGFLILASTESYGSGGTDILLTRTDAEGSVIWAKTIGTSGRELVRTFKRDHSSGYVLLNWIAPSGTTIDDAYILRIDDDGNPVQEKFFGGSDDDELMNFDLTDDGGYIFTGSSRNFPGGGDIALWVIKTDASFIPQWNRTYNSLGLAEHSRKIHETSVGHFICIGNKISPSKEMDHLILYLNSSGDIIWIKEAGGIATDEGRDLLIAENGNFVFAGTTDSYGAGGGDILVYELDPSGNLIWAKTYGGPGNERTLGIVQGEDGNYMISGITSSFGSGGDDLILLNINNSGNLINANSIGGPLDETFPLISAASDSAYVVTCGTYSYGNGGQDVLTIRTDNEGNSCCSESITGLIVQDIALSISNTTVVAGSGMVQPSHNIIINNQNISTDLLCYDGISILGEDTVCSSEGPFKYSLSPNLDLGFQWLLPSDANISSSLGDTVIFVEFGTQSGYIYVTQTGGCDSNPFDSIFVQVYNDAMANAGSDEAICQGISWDFNNSAILPDASLYDSLLWSGGLGGFSNPKVLRPVYNSAPSELGLITLNLTTYSNISCGNGSDEMMLNINANPIVNLGNDTTICGVEGDSVFFDAGPGYANYLWQDGSSEQYYETSDPGTYWVEVTNSDGCQDSDTAVVDLIQLPDLSIGNDTSACGDFSILLEAGIGFDHYTWQDGSSNSSFLATNYGIYWVEAEKDGCQESVDIVIDEDCPSNIWFPNVFTPNSDGKNDRFLPVYENVIRFQIYIYNRWGQLIYESENIDEGWDGKFKGQECSNGVYFFVGYYYDVYHSKDQEIKGSITLLR